MLRAPGVRYKHLSVDLPLSPHRQRPFGFGNVFSIRHAAERMTESWNLTTSVPMPHPPLVLSFHALHSRICLFYFGVLRRVAKGNTGGVTGHVEEGGRRSLRDTIGRFVSRLPQCLTRVCIVRNGTLPHESEVKEKSKD